jgi:hypothetical protein
MTQIEENIWTYREKVTGALRKLHTEGLHHLYSSPNIIRMFKSRRIRWAGHVARMGWMRCAYKIVVVKLEGKRLRCLGG